MGVSNEAIYVGLWGWLGYNRCKNTGHKFSSKCYVSQNRRVAAIARINSPFRLIYITAAESSGSKTGMTTIDSHSPIWNVRDCDRPAHNRHTLDLERQGLRHSVDDWAPVCRNLLLLG